VLRYSRDEGLAVLQGAATLDDAYQRAMALAMIYPEPDKPGRGKKGKAEESSGFSQKRLQQARIVLRHSPDLADRVLKGAATQSESVALSFPSRFLTHFAISMVSLSNAGRPGVATFAPAAA
jgi:hypothetical protein